MSKLKKLENNDIKSILDNYGHLLMFYTKYTSNDFYSLINAKIKTIDVKSKLQVIDEHKFSVVREWAQPTISRFQVTYEDGSIEYHGMRIYVSKDEIAKALKYNGKLSELHDQGFYILDKMKQCPCCGHSVFGNNKLRPNTNYKITTICKHPIAHIKGDINPDYTPEGGLHAIVTDENGHVYEFYNG